METHIVLAEDQEELRSIYATILRNEGYTVWEAAEGSEALELIARHRPALLILDVWMPVLNGFEVVDRLRDDRFASDMKVVMLSNLSDSDTRLEGFSVGVTDYWVKDLSLTQLLANVRRVLAETGVGQDAG